MSGLKVGKRRRRDAARVGAAGWLLLGLSAGALAVAGAGAAGAEKLYRYQDANGNWCFTNVYPETRAEIRVEQVDVGEGDSAVTTRVEGTKLYVRNRLGGPVEVAITEDGLDNMTANPRLPARLVLEGGVEVLAVEFSPVRPDRPSWFRYRYRFALGSPGAEHRPSAPYRLPFPPGKAYRVAQGFGGTFSHNEPESEHAVDFEMPPGSPVCAAREGTVLQVANDFFAGGADRERYGRKANLVRVLHDDGTMGVYAHLQLESVRVGVGQRVAVGKLLGLSGNTGYSTGPHLHFAVERNAGMRTVTVPFVFDTVGSRETAPVRGAVLSN